jgi:hypothetical protein
MSSPSAAPAGAQRPRVHIAPRVKRSDADDAEFLAASYGLVPDEWQRLVLEDWLAVRPDGRWASLTAGLAVPRQNGKNGCIEIRELYGIVALGERFLHTAHEVKTARKAFLRLAAFFENARRWPELAELVKEIRRTNGQEAIVLTNGGSVEFVARSKGSGRGFTVDTLVLDEAQELDDDALEALMPTTSASPLGNPQWIFTGTPPGPKAAGEVFTRTRDEALERKSARLCWHEWSVEGQVDLDDRRAWAATNPGLGIRLQWDVLEGERARFSDEGFARERLGMWDEAAASRVIDAATWGRCADSASQVVSDVAIAVDTTPDQSVTSIAIAGLRADGLPHVEVIENRRGPLDWVVPRLVELVARHRPRALVIDEYSPAMVLADDLKKAKVVVTVTKTRDMVAACGQLYSDVMSARVRHIDQPLLNTALSVARKRAVGDGGGWAWHRKDVESDITPLVSATLARWGAMAPKTKVKRPKRRSGRSSGDRRAVML